MSIFIELTGYEDNLPLAINMDSIKEVIGLPNGGCDLVQEITKKGFQGIRVQEPIGKVMQLWREARKLGG